MENQSYYHAKLNRHRRVEIVNTDLKICEELSLLFRLEGFLTSFSVDLHSFSMNLSNHIPDVVVADMDLGTDSGLLLLRRVKANRSGTLIIMTTSLPQIDVAVAAMRLGALDVMSIPLDKERLLEVVRDGLRRDIHFGAMEGGQRVVEVRGFSQLTAREREVLQLITNGSSNKEAGRELHISPRTVEVHRARVMFKLGAKNTADLMRIVMSS